MCTVKTVRRPSIARAWLWLSLPLLHSPAPRTACGWLGAASSHARARQLPARGCAADEHHENPWPPTTLLQGRADARWLRSVTQKRGRCSMFGAIDVEGWRLTLLPGDPVELDELMLLAKNHRRFSQAMPRWNAMRSWGAGPTASPGGAAERPALVPAQAWLPGFCWRKGRR